MMTFAKMKRGEDNELGFILESREWLSYKENLGPKSQDWVHKEEFCILYFKSLYLKESRIVIARDGKEGEWGVII